MRTRACSPCIGDANEKVETGALVRMRAHDGFASGVLVSVKILGDAFERLGIAPARPHANELNLGGAGGNEGGGENGQEKKQTHERTLSASTTADKFFAAVTGRCAATEVNHRNGG